MIKLFKSWTAFWVTMCIILLGTVILVVAQQINTDLLPVSTGLNLGHSNQRWNAFVQTLDVAGNATISGNATVTGTLTAGGIPALSYCGTVSTCGNTAQAKPYVVFGKVTVSGNNATISAISPPFASTASSCVCSDNTSSSNGCLAALNSTTTIGITAGGASDTVSYSCFGTQ